jgi:hypothetical protein
VTVDPGYIFNHIPKTAGTTLIDVIRNLLGSDRVSPHIDINEDRPYEISPEQFERYFVIAGHFGVKWHAYMGHRRSLTVLREPIDRVLSTYYFWRNNAPRRPDVSYLNLAQTLSLDEFVRCGDRLVLQGISNAQTWQLADDLREKYRSVSESDALGLAKTNLLHLFDFVGLYEKLEESIARLCVHLRLPSVDRISPPKVNQTVDRKYASELAAFTIDQILDLNRMDVELYRFAQELWSTPDHTKG